MNLITTNNALTMTSFELLDVVNMHRVQFGLDKIRYNDFAKRVADELDGEDYESFVVQNMNKTTSTGSRLNRDQCLLVGMRESKSVRKAVLSTLKGMLINKQPALPQTFSEALQLAADQAKQLELQAPKVEFHDTVVQTDQTYKYQEAGKKLQQRPNKFVAWLRDNNYITAQNVPYQRYIDQGLFKMSSGVKNDHAFTQGRVTGKGLAYFTNKLKDMKL